MSFKVMLQGGEPATFNLHTGERILHAGLAKGLPLPYECGTGTCGQCRAVLESGSVDHLWPDAPGTGHIRRARNEILMCQSTPSADCVLRVSPAIPDTIRPSYFKASVAGIEVIAPDVIILSVETESLFEGLPGQFALLEAPAIQGPRAYSLTETGPTTRLEFLVRRKSGGLFSQWLFSEDCNGQPITLFGPIGKATYKKDVDKDLLLAAGGTGVASTISILHAAKRARHFETHRAHVYFGVRTPDDVFCLEQLRHYANGFPGSVNISICFSDSPAHDFAQDNIRFRSGFVHEVVGQDLANINNAESTALMSGPPPMIEAMLKTLIKAKFSPRQIRYDKFN